MSNARPAADGTTRTSSSARVRILGWYVVLLGAALIAALLLQRAFLLAQAESDAEEALDQEVGELRQLASGTDPETGQPFGGDVEAIFDTFLARNVPLEGEGLLTYVSGSLYKTDVIGSQVAALPIADEWGDLTESRRGVLEDSSLGALRYLAVPLLSEVGGNGVFVVAVLMDDRLDRVEGVVQLGALVYGSIFLLASALAWVAAGRVLRPLRSFADTARSVTDTEDLTRRIDVEGDDEISELGRTFNSMLDRLDDAFASQRRFIDDAGHELRTPITVIRGNLEVMGEDPEDRRQTVALVMDELDRMSRIVDDLLDLAKAEQPDFIQVGPVDLAEATHEVASKAAVLDSRPWLVEEVEHAVVVADRHRLNQAMMNLVRNAAEHTPSGRPVHIGSSLEHGMARLWVRDEGEAIPDEMRQQIFDRFSRLHTGRRRTDGAGLGLAIVKAIAEAHGGSVSVGAHREGGNVFTIEVPANPRGDRPA